MLPFAAQAIPSLPEILTFPGLCPPSFLIGENDTPARIPVDNHCEAAQVPERHDQFPFLRGQVVHHGSTAVCADQNSRSVKKGSDRLFALHLKINLIEPASDSRRCTGHQARTKPMEEET
jgi:hypothetical protein